MNLSAPLPEGRGLPFDRLKALSLVDGLKVHPFDFAQGKL